MNKYKIVRIKKEKIKDNKCQKWHNYFKPKWFCLILLGVFSLFGIGGTTITLYTNNLTSASSNLNMKIENLAQFKKATAPDNFKFSVIDEYIKANFNNEDNSKAILDTYGDINKFKENDTKIYEQLGISSLTQLLDNEFIANSWFDNYYHALMTNNFSSTANLELAWNNIYNSGIHNSDSNKNSENYYQFEFLATVKDCIEMQAQLQKQALSDNDKKDLREGMKFIKNMQYQFLIKNKWYRLLAYSFNHTLTNEQLLQKQAYFNDLKSITNKWITNMEKELYSDNNQWFWNVTGYNNKKDYESAIKFQHQFFKNDNITRNDLDNILKASNFFSQLNTTKKTFTINDFCIKYNGYTQIEQKNEGTQENPKYSWRNYYQFTFKFKDNDACFNLNIADNNFRFINLDFDTNLKYNDIFENYQKKYLVDLLENKASWLILFDLLK